MNRRLLEHQADRLERVLTEHQAPGRVTGGTVTPRWVRFQVLPARGVKVDRVRSLSEELARALAVDNVRVSRRGGAVAVEVPRDDPQSVRLLPLMDQLDANGGMPGGCTALLGLGDDGAPLLIRLPSPDVAHVLVAGTTGSGKTVLLRSMVMSLALTHKPSQLALVLVDPRDGRAFDCFGGVPHLVRPVIRDVGEAAEVLSSLVRLMIVRDRERVSRPVVGLFIDELADLLMGGGDDVERWLTRILQRGRGVGIHVVAATQKPTAAVLGPLVKANFPVRLVGRVTSTEDARTAAGQRATGAERLGGRGDFLAVAEGRVTRFQAAYISESEIDDELSARGWDAPAVAEAPEVQVIQLPPPPEPEADPVDELAARLVAMQWDISQSYRAACRALDLAEGGGPFALVQQAVDRLREGGAGGATAMLQRKENENSDRSSGPAVLSGRSRNSSTPWAAAALEWEGDHV